jgi:hypothetical protein
MIARQESTAQQADVWTRLAAPLPQSSVAWRQDGRIITREGKPFARFVAYVEANTVRERLDSVAPGEWDLTLDLLPAAQITDDSADSAACAFKARLQVLGVVREDVGTGKDYKQAATDAFKRAAVRFGVANELYAYETNWVLMDSDGRDARPVEDPALSYERRYGQGTRPLSMRRGNLALSGTPSSAVAAVSESSVTAVAAGAEQAVSCPKCGSGMWDNRATKRNPKAPDFKCRDRGCDGVIWPPKGGHQVEARDSEGGSQRTDSRLAEMEEEIPF